MTTAQALDPARWWRTHPREAISLALAGAVALGLSAALAVSAGDAAVDPGAAPPPPPPMTYRPIAPGQAQLINAALPVTARDLAAARPFTAAAGSTDYRRALACLTSAVYYEAGREPDAGQRAVAQVVLNRVRHPAFPATVCGVVFEGSTRPTGCQFTFTCDGSMARAPERAAWERARLVAEQALAGSVYAGVGQATHYHANYVVPYWSASLAKAATVGAHLFYRWNGAWGQAGAFVQNYKGHEPDPVALRAAALAAPHVVPIYEKGPSPSATVAEVAGAPVIKEGKRVRVLFTPQGRAAAEVAVNRAQTQRYTERVAASDNLKWALGDESGAAQPALGTAGGAPSGSPAAQR